MDLSEFKATLAYISLKSNRDHAFDPSTWDHTPLIPALRRWRQEVIWLVGEEAAAQASQSEDLQRGMQSEDRTVPLV